jgi:hypothetical protein
MASNSQFNYEFTESAPGVPDDGINFGSISYSLNGDIKISCDIFNIYGWCTRWDVNDYKAIVDTYIAKEDYNRIRDNIVPGAATELYNILGRPTFYDTTWNDKNTVTITPNRYTHQNDVGVYSGDNNSNLVNMRDSITLLITTFGEHHISNRYVGIHLEGFIK